MGPTSLPLSLHPTVLLHSFLSREYSPHRTCSFSPITHSHPLSIGDLQLAPPVPPMGMTSHFLLSPPLGALLLHSSIVCCGGDTSVPLHHLLLQLESWLPTVPNCQQAMLRGACSGATWGMWRYYVERAVLLLLAMLLLP